MTEYLYVYIYVIILINVYETMGFAVKRTRVIAEEKGFPVNMTHVTYTNQYI